MKALCCATILLLSVKSFGAELREWRYESPNRSPTEPKWTTTTARFVGLNHGSVILDLGPYSRIHIPFKALSRADQHYVTSGRAELPFTNRQGIAAYTAFRRQADALEAEYVRKKRALIQEYLTGLQTAMKRVLAAGDLDEANGLNEAIGQQNEALKLLDNP